MDEKILRIIAQIGSMALWGWIVFYFMGGMQIMQPLLYQQNYQTGGLSGMTKVLPLLFTFLVWFIPVILVSTLTKNKGPKKE